MYKVIFELITEPLGLPIEWYKEWLALALIELIASEIAFSKVRILYHVSISGKSAGSLAYWTIKSVVAVAIWAVTYGVIWVGKLIWKHKLYVSIGISCIVAVVLCVKLLIWLRNRNKLVKCVVRTENEEI